jgi:hypothetical protein
MAMDVLAGNQGFHGNRPRGDRSGMAARLAGNQGFHGNRPRGDRAALD